MNRHFERVGALRDPPEAGGSGHDVGSHKIGSNQAWEHAFGCCVTDIQTVMLVALDKPPPYKASKLVRLSSIAVPDLASSRVS